MPEGFDAAGYVQIDLERGELATRDGGERRHVVVPFELVSSIARAAATAEGGAAALYVAGRSWGESLGEVFGQELSSNGRIAGDATPKEFTSRLAGSLAAMDWGRAAVETWGKALVVAIRELPGGAAGPERQVLAGVLAGIVSGIAGKPFACAVIDRGLPEGEARFFLGAPRAVKAARRWHEESGATVGEIVSRLMSGQRDPCA